MDFARRIGCLVGLSVVLGPSLVLAKSAYVCANLFRPQPQQLHSMQYSRMKDDQRLRVRRFDPLTQLAHRVSIMHGRLYYRGELLDTSKGTADGIHRRGIQILALDKNMNLITTEHAPAGVLHHSTLTNGEPGYFFGEWRVTQGKVMMVSNMSGHFLPSVEQLHIFVEFLRWQNVLHPDVNVVEIELAIDPD